METSLWAVAADPCPAPGRYCDQFQLTVAVAPDYWEDRAGGARVALSWEDPSDAFDVIVLDQNGTRVAQARGAINSTAVSTLIPNASGTYTVRAVYFRTVAAGYHGEATFVDGTRRVIFSDDDALGFAPATIVSAHFLGAEPGITMERPLKGWPSVGLDRDRIFVDWPLGSQSQTGQLNRSLDGGDSFRLLFDPTCPARNRPNCLTGGGADTAVAVNPFTGTLFFTDQEGFIDEAIASSTDHGDSFPVDRQFAFTNAPVVPDRQWIAATDPRLLSIGGRPIEAFLSYRAGITGMPAFVQAIDSEGLPIPQPIPQLPRVGRPGPLVVDNGVGPGRGWIYQPHGFGDGVSIATAHVSEFHDPNAWETRLISTSEPEIFPWLDVDADGNAYAVWVQGTPEGAFAVHYRASPIADVRNDPRRGGRPGSYWIPMETVSLPSLGSTIFAEVVAGDRERIAIAYLGTTAHSGPSHLATPGTPWHAYAAVILNPLRDKGPAVVHTGPVSHRPMHTGNISCRDGRCSGLDDEDDKDDSLLDFIDLGSDAEGRLGVVFGDNNSSFGFPPNAASDNQKNLPFTHFSKQVSGPSMMTDVRPLRWASAEGGRGDHAGDATWPNTAGGKNLPALDVLGSSIALEGEDLVARVRLSDASPAGMTRDLETYDSTFDTDREAGALQYVVRFLTADQIYHLSMTSDPDGARTYFGGLLDANDRLFNVGGETIGAAYRPDPSYGIRGEIVGDTLVLRAPADDFNLDDGSRLYSVTAFAMAGPTAEQDALVRDLLLDPMRTVDASPPFDARL